MKQFLTLPHNVNAVTGALRLALFDARGLARFDDSRDSAIASFIVPILMLFPLLYVAYDQAAVNLTTTEQVVLHMVREALGYAVAYTGFIVAMFYITELMQRGQRYNLLLCALNWSTPVQVFMIGAGYYLYSLDIFPEIIANVILLVSGVFVFVYTWFILRASLAISKSMASLLTGMLIAICLLLNQITLS